MKTTNKLLILMTLTFSLNAFGQEDRMVAHLDLGLQREVTKVTVEEVETVTGIVQQMDETEEGADVEPADAD